MSHLAVLKVAIERLVHESTLLRDTRCNDIIHLSQILLKEIENPSSAKLGLVVSNQPCSENISRSTSFSSTDNRRQSLEVTVAPEKPWYADFEPRLFESEEECIWRPFKLAIKSGHVSLLIVTLDGIQKLVAHHLLNGNAKLLPGRVFPEENTNTEKSRKTTLFSRFFKTKEQEKTDDFKEDEPSEWFLIDDIIDTIYTHCSSFQNDTLDLQLLKVMLTLVTSTHTMPHGATLLKAFQTCLNIHASSKHNINLVTAKASLTQMLHAVLKRAEVQDDRTFPQPIIDPHSSMRSSVSSLLGNLFLEEEAAAAAVVRQEPPPLRTLTAPFCERTNSEQDRQDVFLIVKRLSKLIATPSVGGTNNNNVLYDVKMQFLALELLFSLLTHCDEKIAFAAPMIDLLKYELSPALQSCDLYLPAQLYEMSLSVVFFLYSRYRSALKGELEGLFKKYVIYPLNPTARKELPLTLISVQRLVLLKALFGFLSDAQLFLDLYLNYDCDLSTENLFEVLLAELCKMTLPSSQVLSTPIAFVAAASSSSSTAAVTATMDDPVFLSDMVLLQHIQTSFKIPSMPLTLGLYKTLLHLLTTSTLSVLFVALFDYLRELSPDLLQESENQPNDASDLWNEQGTHAVSSSSSSPSPSGSPQESHSSLSPSVDGERAAEISTLSGTNHHGNGIPSSTASKRTSEDRPLPPPPLPLMISSKQSPLNRLFLQQHSLHPRGPHPLKRLSKRDGNESTPADPLKVIETKSRKQKLMLALEQFHGHPYRGLCDLIDMGFFQSHEEDNTSDTVIPKGDAEGDRAGMPSPALIARICVFLRTSDKVSPTMVGELLGDHHDVSVAVMHRYMDDMDFHGMSLLDALRYMVSHFKLPGEAQKIDRIMLKFADRYCECHPESFSSADTIYALGFSCILLNTDLHHPEIKRRMTLDEYVKLCRGMRDVDAVPDDLLMAIYNDLAAHELLLKGDTDVSPSTQRAPVAMATGTHPDPVVSSETPSLSDTSTAIDKTVTETAIETLPLEQNHLAAAVNETPRVSMETVAATRPRDKKTASTATLPSRRPKKTVTPFSSARHIDYVHAVYVLMTASVMDMLMTHVDKLLPPSMSPTEAVHSGLVSSLPLDTVFKTHQEELLLRVRLAVQLACALQREEERRAIVQRLCQSTGLEVPLTLTHVRVMRTLFSVAYVCGDALADSWTSVVTLGMARVDLLAWVTAPTTDKTLVVPQLVSALQWRQWTESPVSADMTALNGLIDALLAQTATYTLPTLLIILQAMTQFTPPAATATGGEGDHAPPLAMHRGRRGSGKSDSPVRRASHSSGTATPRALLESHDNAFMLRRIVMLCLLAMERIRLDWMSVWELVKGYFVRAGLHRRYVSVAMASIDGVKDILLAWLERGEELVHFHSDLFDVYRSVFMATTEVSAHRPMIREYIVQSVYQIAVSRGHKLRAGWKGVLDILSSAAALSTSSSQQQQPMPSTTASAAVVLVAQAFKVLDYCIQTYGSLLILCWVELIECLEEFLHCPTEQQQLKDNISSMHDRALVLLLQCAKSLAEHLDEKAKEEEDRHRTTEVDSNHQNENPSTSSDEFYLTWFPLLSALSRIVMDTRSSTLQTKALDAYFFVLTTYGRFFGDDVACWSSILHSTLLPVFDDLPEARSTGVLGTHVMHPLWLSALQQWMALYSASWPALRHPAVMKDTLGILARFVLPAYETLAHAGLVAWQQWVLRNSVWWVGKERGELLLRFLEDTVEVTLPAELLLPRQPSKETTTTVTTGIPFSKTGSDGVDQRLWGTLRMYEGTEGGLDMSSASSMDYKWVIGKCVVHLMVLRAMRDLSNERLLYEQWREEEALQKRWLTCLLRSFAMARAFNEDVALRAELYKLGFVQQMPNLLKQEVMAMSTAMTVLLRVRDRPWAMTLLCHLCHVLVSRYTAMLNNGTEYGRELASWSPLVAFMMESLSTLDWKKETAVFQLARKDFEVWLMLMYSEDEAVKKSLQLVLRKVAREYLV